MYVLDWKCSSLLLYLFKSKRSVWEFSFWCNVFFWESNEDFYLVIFKILYFLFYIYRGMLVVYVIYVDNNGVLLILYI